MTPNAVSLVQTSWNEAKCPVFTWHFYTDLFKSQDIKSLFTDVDMEKQAKALLDMLSAAVTGLDNPEELIPTLRELGARHVEYGVLSEHYDIVGAALINTLKLCVENFDEDMNLAWQEAYAIIRDEMLIGAATV